MNEFIEAIDKGISWLSSKGVSIPASVENNLYGPFRGAILALSRLNEIRAYKSYSQKQWTLKIMDVTIDPLDQEQCIFHGICHDDEQVTKIAILMLQNIRQDHLDMESLGYEAFRFTQFKRETPKYVFTAKRIFETNEFDLSSNKISGITFSNGLSMDPEDPEPWCGFWWLSTKRLRDTVIEREKAMIDITGLDSMNSVLRDLIVKHE